MENFDNARAGQAREKLDAENELQVYPAGDAAHHLHSHFTNKLNLSKLLKMYRRSDAEHRRQGKLEQQIGSSREKDLIASLKSNPALLVDYDLDPMEEADVKVNDELISIKHTTNGAAGDIKLKWIGDLAKQQQFINDHSFTHNMLIVQVALPKYFIKITYIDLETMQRLKEQFLAADLKVFNTPGGNSKGVAMTSKFYNALMAAGKVRVMCRFSAGVQHGFDPIQERLQYINER